MRFSFRTRTGRAVAAVVLGLVVGIGVAGLPRSTEVPPTPTVAPDDTSATSTTVVAP